jgi:hypothetical protein
MDTANQLTEIQRTFVPPARLGESRPRYVRMTRAGRALFVLAILLFIGALGAMIALSREARRKAERRAALVERGVMTTGEVTRLWQSGDNRRKVVYRFQADGRTITGEIKVSAERRRQLEVGAPIAVRYLPGDPRANDLGGRPRSGMPRALGPIVAAGIGTCGALCLLGIRGQRRLLEEGRVAPAIVTGHTVHRTQHGKHRSMTYEFQLLSGAPATGKSGTSSKPPAVGSVITVIYDPDRPRRSRVYPLSLVEPG